MTPEAYASLAGTYDYGSSKDKSRALENISSKTLPQTASFHIRSAAARYAMGPCTG